MTHGSLFSGIGGFDLASEWMGWENVFHCEIDSFCQKVLKYYWPKAISYDDIKKTDFTIWRGKLDILTGGFPCQPYSLAGKRKGKEDERHLWPEMLRAIREIQPRWVVGENVFGLVNWSGGLVFHEVQADLEAAGYEVWPYVLPACAVNAPHRRDRVWFVAHRKDIGLQFTGASRSRGPGFKNGNTTPHPDSNGCQRVNGQDEKQSSEGGQYAQHDIEQIDAADTNEQQRPEGGMHKTEPKEAERYAGTRNARSNGGGTWDNFPTQSPVCVRNDGLPAKLDGITFSKWGNESIKAAGNAVVPQVVLQIFKSIEQYEKTNPN